VLAKNMPPVVPAATLAGWTKLNFTASAANIAATSGAADKAKVLVGLFTYDMNPLILDC